MPAHTKEKLDDNVKNLDEAIHRISELLHPEKMEVFKKTIRKKCKRGKGNSLGVKLSPVEDGLK